MINFKKISLAGAIFVSVLALSACNSYKATTTSSNPSVSSTTSAADEAGAVVITYTNSGFSPDPVNAKVGQKVIFKNNSSAAVQVNSAPHPTHTLFPELNIGTISAGASGATSFAKPGTYKYHNHLDASQNGTIIVQ